MTVETVQLLPINAAISNPSFPQNRKTKSKPRPVIPQLFVTFPWKRESRPLNFHTAFGPCPLRKSGSRLHEEWQQAVQLFLNKFLQRWILDSLSQNDWAVGCRLKLIILATFSSFQWKRKSRTSNFQIIFEYCLTTVWIPACARN